MIISSLISIATFDVLPSGEVLDATMQPPGD